MNSGRSTKTPTPLDWLDIVQRGGTEDWKQLYRLCHDIAVARQLAQLLPCCDPDLFACARLWKFLLEDLHPGLQVDLPENPGPTAV